jgi:hypothetical protein
MGDHLIRDVPAACADEALELVDLTDRDIT